jgi:predicted RNA methylase
MIRLARILHPGTNFRMFEVDFITWMEFRDAIIAGATGMDSPIWPKISQATCLIGGVDVSLSYL